MISKLFFLSLFFFPSSTRQWPNNTRYTRVFFIHSTKKHVRLSAASNNDPRSVFVASIAYGTKKKRKKKRASVELCQNNARESYSKPRTMNRAVLGGRARKFKVTRLRGSCTLDPTERERKREKKKKKKEFFRYTRNKFIANPVERNGEWGRLFSSNIRFATV